MHEEGDFLNDLSYAHNFDRFAIVVTIPFHSSRSITDILLLAADTQRHRKPSRMTRMTKTKADG